MPKHLKKSSLLLMILAANGMVVQSAHASDLLAPPPGGYKFSVEGMDVRASQLDDPQHVIFLRPRYHWGFDLSGAYDFAHGDADVTVDWVHVGSKTDTDTAVPAVAPFGEVTLKIPPVGIYPVAPFDGNTLETQQQSYGYDEVIAEIGHSFHSHHFDLRFAAGVFYVPLKFNSQDQFVLTNGSTGTIGSLKTGSLINGTLTNYKSTDFDGIGPHISTQGVFHFGNSGFHLVGGIGGGFLFGNSSSTSSASSSSLVQISNSTVNTRVFSATGSFNSDAKIIVPELDGKIGLAYSHVWESFANGHTQTEHELSIEAGWRAWSYFNILRVNSDALMPGQVVGEGITIALPEAITSTSVASHNFSINGPYVKVSYSFS